MRLTTVDRKEFNHAYYKQTKLQAVLEEFIAMNTPVARVDDHEYKDATACCSTLGVAAKRWTKNVAVRMRGGNVYLVRTDMED